MGKLRKYSMFLGHENWEKLMANGLMMQIHKFNRVTGDIEFETANVKGLCEWLEKHLDFGATTAAEVFGFPFQGKAAWEWEANLTWQLENDKKLASKKFAGYDAP